MEELNRKFENLITEKEQQFILLNMERIKEEDKEYLITLSKEQLFKLRDNIKKNCEIIFNIDKTLIKICKYIKDVKDVKDENDKNYKLFKHYLNLNNELNTYLLILMIIPLNHINIYKQYHNSKINIGSIFYENNPEILVDGLQITSPLKEAASPPNAASPPSKIPPRIQQPKA